MNLQVQEGGRKMSERQQVSGCKMWDGRRGVKDLQDH